MLHEDGRSARLLCESIIDCGVQLIWVCCDISLDSHIIGFLYDTQSQFCFFKAEMCAMKHRERGIKSLLA